MASTEVHRADGNLGSFSLVDFEPPGSGVPTIQYDYASDGELIGSRIEPQSTAAGPTRFSYRYDGDQRVSEGHDAGGYVADYQYVYSDDRLLAEGPWVAGGPSSITPAPTDVLDQLGTPTIGIARTTYFYAADRSVRSIVLGRPGDLFERFDLSYDDAHRLSSVTSSGGSDTFVSGTTLFRYDCGSRAR
jgi:hypothetical protein